MFGLNTLQLGAVALAAAFFMSGVAYVKGRSDGKHLAKMEALKTINSQLLERAETDAEINETDLAGLCVLLGGEWMPDDERCD
ncbi:hypothetical protein AB1P65_09565 [Roseibium alexandrii]